MTDLDFALYALRNSMSQLSPIGDTTWRALEQICTFQSYDKGDIIYRAGEVPRSYAYVFRGLVRCFVCDEKGNEYNKNFFDEGMFPGSMTSLLKSTPSALVFEAVENSKVLEIDFRAYRQLLIEREDLKLFQIYYLEKNWLLAKDAREIELVQDDATARYLAFIDQYPRLVDRLPQYHIASHLGITPTQLSRIRKKI